MPYYEPEGGGNTFSKADKVIGAVNGDLAGLDSTGNLTDSGKKPADFLNVDGSNAMTGLLDMGGHILAHVASINNSGSSITIDDDVDFGTNFVSATGGTLNITSDINLHAKNISNLHSIIINTLGALEFGSNGTGIEFGPDNTLSIANNDSGGQIVVGDSAISFNQNNVNMDSGLGSGGGTLNMDGGRIVSLTDPTNPQDAATKNYVDTSLVTYSAWTYRISVELPASRSVPVDNTAVHLVLNQGNFDFSKAKSDGSDIRIIDSDGTTVLTYYLASYSAANKLANLWVLIPHLPSGTKKIVSLLAGNASATAVSSFANTFNILPTTSSTLAAWKLNEGTGSTSVDASGNGHTLSLVGSPAWTSELTKWDYTATGFTGGAIALDGSSQYLNAGTVLDVVPASGTIAFSFVPSTGFNPQVGTNIDYFFRKHFANGNAFDLRMHPFNAAIVIDVGSLTFNSATTLTWTVGQVYEIAVTWTPTHLQVIRSNPVSGATDILIDKFCNLVPGGGTGTVFEGSASGAASLVFGCSKDSTTASGFLHGKLDNIIVEARPWTQYEFTARRVTLTNYVPNVERDYWLRDASPISTSTVPIGEVSTDFVTATQTLHLYQPNSLNTGINYTTSIDYGQTFAAETAVTLTGVSGTVSHSCHFVDTDGFIYIYYNDNAGNIFSVKSASAGNRTSFSNKQTVFNAVGAGLTVDQLANTSVTKKGSTYYMAVEGKHSSPWYTLFATSATPQGTFALIANTTPSGLMQPLPSDNSGSQQSANPCLRYDDNTDTFHLFFDAGYQALPTEPCHAVSTDNCVTWTADFTNGPIFWTNLYDSTNTNGSNFRDQIGDTDVCVCTLPDGSTLLLGIAIQENNQATPIPLGANWRWTFAGPLSALTTQDAPIFGTESTTTYLPLTGGKMLGSINLNNHNITNGGTITASSFVGALTGNATTATTAGTISGSITESQVTGLTTDLAAKLTSLVLNTPSAVFTTPAGSSTVSGVETITLALKTQTANTVFAGPTTGAASAPTFRALVANDIPSLSGLYLPLSGGTLTGGLTAGTTYQASIGDAGASNVTIFTTDAPYPGRFVSRASGDVSMNCNIDDNDTTDDPTLAWIKFAMNTSNAPAHWFAVQNMNPSMASWGAPLVIDTDTNDVWLVPDNPYALGSGFPSQGNVGNVYIGGDRSNGSPLIALSNTGNITAVSFNGDGAGITNIPESAVNSLTTDLAAKLPLAGGTLTGNLTISTHNIVTDTSTGTQLGTATGQKIGLHGSTPSIQRVGAAQAAVATTAPTQTTPFGFTTSAQAAALVTLVNELRAALVEKGIIKGSA